MNNEPASLQGRTLPDMHAKVASGPSNTELVSVITPSYGRPDMLPGAYSVFASQNYPNLEWLVVDDSEERCSFFDGLNDPRVRYFHLGERTSIGLKRNLAAKEARGTIIAHFDDDDYYHPKYVEAMVEAMQQNDADLVKLASFFIYHTKTGALGYWNLRLKTLPHYSFAPAKYVAPGYIIREEELADIHLGYGFSYVFKRPVWEASPFEDKSWNEDVPFIKKAIENRFKLSLVDDNSGVCLHMIHDRNASTSFPQFLLRDFMLDRFFPSAGVFIAGLNRRDGAVGITSGQGAETSLRT